VVTGDYAETLRSIAREGPDLRTPVRLKRTPTTKRRLHHARRPDALSQSDSRGTQRQYRGLTSSDRRRPCPGRCTYPDANILEGYDIGALGFASADTLHLLAEVLKIAFADRAAATADPAFVKVPVAKLLSKTYAADRRSRIDLGRAQRWSAEVAPGEGAHTTHLTVADGMGNIVASTQTINSLFGARYIVPGTGMIPNNYMFVVTPHPGRANSVAPGKRITSSMSPVMVLKDGRPRWALGLPGGLRIFPSVMQAISNLIDHGMTVQEAVEAPRLWTQGFGVEVEKACPDAGCAGSRSSMRRRLAMSARHDIQFHADGVMTGARSPARRRHADCPGRPPEGAPGRKRHHARRGGFI
jgi:gamma-glutamyltranspeptidase/glutathione hydrolase